MNKLNLCFVVVSDFDIVLPRGTNGTAVTYLHEGTETFTDFTLALWFSTHNVSTKDVKINLMDAVDNSVVSFDPLRSVIFNQK